MGSPMFESLQNFSMAQLGTNQTVSTTLIAPLWVVASMANLDCQDPGGEGKEVQFPTPLVLLLLSELWFDDQPKPPLPHPPLPSSTCDWSPFVIFHQAALVFALFLFYFRSLESFILLRCLFFYQRLKLLNFFPPRTNANAESPEFALLDPSKF